MIFVEHTDNQQMRARCISLHRVASRCYVLPLGITRILHSRHALYTLIFASSSRKPVQLPQVCLTSLAAQGMN
eukprot:s275_g18.t1